MTDRSGIYHPAALALFSLSASVVLLVASYLGLNALPLQDDFCRAARVPVADFPPKVLPVGLYESVRWSYINWSGRWSGIGLETVMLNAVALPRRYPLLLVVLAGAQWFLLFEILRTVLKSQRLALTSSMAVALLCWANLPSVGEGVFWLTGGIENQLPLMISIWLVVWLASRRHMSNTQLAIATALGFVLPGFHELAGITLLAVLLSIVTVTFSSRTPGWQRWAIVAVSVGIGFAVVLVAPGNAIRAAYEADTTNRSSIVPVSVRVVRDYLVPWILDFKLWLLTLLICLEPKFASIQPPVAASSRRVLSLLLCGWLMLLAITLAVPIWVMRAMPAGRTLNFAYGIFVLGWLVLVFIMTRPLAEAPIAPALARTLASTALGLFSLLILGSGNTRLAVVDIYSGHVAAWHRELQVRFLSIALEQSGAHTRVNRLSVMPRVYFQRDITESPSYWSNRCWSAYFGLESISVAGQSRLVP
jgi:Family of unknown function (DUF6056)